MAQGTPALQVRGLPQLRRALDQLGEDLTDLRKVNMEVALLVAGRAVGNAPKDSGDLAVSTRARATRYRARVTSNLVYANPIHWGWKARGIAPSLYASAAAQQTEAVWLPRYVNFLQDLCDKAAASCPPPSPLSQ